MENESKESGVSQLARGMLRTSLKMRRRQLEICSALEVLVDSDDAEDPRVRRHIDQFCKDLGIVGADRLGGIRRKRAELEGLAETLVREIRSLDDRGRFDDETQ